MIFEAMKEQTNVIDTIIYTMCMNYSAEWKVRECQDYKMLFCMEIHLLSLNQHMSFF